MPRGRPKKSTPEKREVARLRQQRNRAQKRKDLEELEVQYAKAVEDGVGLVELENLRKQIVSLKHYLSSVRDSAWFAKTPEAVKQAQQSQSPVASTSASFVPVPETSPGVSERPEGTVSYIRIHFYCAYWN